jgi:hypothetical protein
MGDAGTLSLPATAALVRLADRWLLDDVGRGRVRLLDALPGWLGRVLAQLTVAGPITAGQARAVVLAAGVPESEVERCVTSLSAAGLLSEHPAAVPPADSAVLRDYQFANISQAVDYADPAAIDEDIRLMYRYAEADRPPAVLVELPAGAFRVPLPHPVLDPAGHPLDRLGRCLFLTHGVLSDTAIGPLPRTRRVPPSHGAAHPFDLLLTTARDVDAGSYYYDPGEHCLVLLADDTTEHGDDVILDIRLAVERVQWRYRTSAVYPTIFLDLGHLLETLELVSAEVGLCAERLPEGGGPPLPPGPFGPALARYRLSPFDPSSGR